MMRPSELHTSVIKSINEIAQAFDLANQGFTLKDMKQIGDSFIILNLTKEGEKYSLIVSSYNSDLNNKLHNLGILDQKEITKINSGSNLNAVMVPGDFSQYMTFENFFVDYLKGKKNERYIKGLTIFNRIYNIICQMDNGAPDIQLINMLDFMLVKDNPTAKTIDVKLLTCFRKKDSGMLMNNINTPLFGPYGIIRNDLINSNKKAVNTLSSQMLYLLVYLLTGEAMHNSNDIRKVNENRHEKLLNDPMIPGYVKYFIKNSIKLIETGGFLDLKELPKMMKLFNADHLKMLLMLSRDYSNQSLVHADNLPLDMFKLLLKEINNKNWADTAIPYHTLPAATPKIALDIPKFKGNGKPSATTNASITVPAKNASVIKAPAKNTSVIKAPATMFPSKKVSTPTISEEAKTSLDKGKELLTLAKSLEKDAKEFLEKYGNNSNLKLMDPNKMAGNMMLQAIDLKDQAQSEFQKAKEFGHPEAKKYIEACSSEFKLQ